MSYTLEGKIEIPLEDFWQWFHENYVPSGLRSSEYVCGVPRVNISNMQIEVDVALDSDDNPRNWIEPPAIIKEWDEIKISYRTLKHPTRNTNSFGS